MIQRAKDFNGEDKKRTEEVDIQLVLFVELAMRHEIVVRAGRERARLTHVVFPK